jgi:hypothetical protein
VQRADGHRGQQFITVGEVPVGRGHRDTQPFGQLGQRELAQPAFGDQLNGPVDQGGLEVAVVVGANPRFTGRAGAFRRGS